MTCFSRICVSRKIVISSASGLNTSRCSSLLQRGQLPSTVLDLGCGPMRLGSVLIPQLKDYWYYDKTSTSTIAFGERSFGRPAFPSRRPTPLCLDQFDLSCDLPVQIAFSNSLFSHLTLNSILTALLQLQTVLAPSGVLYATFFSLSRMLGLNPTRATNGDVNLRLIPIKTLITIQLLRQDLAMRAGFRMDVVDDFGHPTQTMGRFRRPRRQRWFC